MLLPAPAGVAGAWEKAEDDERGLKYLFRDEDGAIRGYVLTRDRCQERTDMDRSLIETMSEAAAA